MSAETATLEVAHAKLNATLKKMSQDFSTGTRTSLVDWSRYALKRFVASRLSGGSGALRRRTGSLARSFRFEVSGKGLDSQTRFATDAPYARLQEHGGKITAKKAKALAIPLMGSPAVTPAGVPRYPSGHGRSLRNTLPKDYTFWVYKAPSGKVFLMGAKKTEGGKASRSNKGRAQAWFQLKKSVTIKPRMKFAESIRLYVKVFSDKLAQTAERIFRGGRP